MAAKAAVEITAVHKMDGELMEPIVTRHEAELFFKEDYIYLMYKEEDADNQVTTSRLKIKDGIAWLEKSGATNWKMCFEQGKTHASDYITPYGIFPMEVETLKFALNRSPVSAQLELGYRLFIHGELSSACEMKFCIRWA